MKIKRSGPLELVIEDFPLFPGLVTLPAALFMLCKIQDRFHEPLAFDMDLIGPVIAFLGFFFATALFNERSLSIFRIYERRLIWKRVGLLGRKAGIIPFDKIRNVIAQTGLSDCSVTYRLALVMETEKVPFTRFYGAGAKEECKRIAKVILQLLGKDSSRLIEDSILEIVASGNTIPEIKLAQEHSKMKLDEAKKFVEGLPR